MVKKIKILIILGTRPQYIKISPFLKFLNTKKNINKILIDTGQHYSKELTKNIKNSIFFSRINYNLNLQNNSKFLRKAIIMIHKIIKKHDPNIILCVGDTQSTVAACLSAKKAKIPCAHIEAGIRSGDMSMIEERNRINVDKLSNLLFAPNLEAKKNLIREKVKGKIIISGDIMYETFYNNKSKINNLKKNFFKFKVEKKKFNLLTIHRDFNTLEIKKFKKIINFVIDHSNDKKIIFLAHPRLKKILNKIKLDKKIILCKPQNYITTQNLIKNCSMVFTDSGGIQKEAYFNRVRCITLRNNTEWNDTIKNGWNKLWTDNFFKKKKKIIFKKNVSEIIANNIEKFLKYEKNI